MLGTPPSSCYWCCCAQALVHYNHASHCCMCPAASCDIRLLAAGYITLLRTHLSRSPAAFVLSSLQALVLRYGELRQLEVLTALAGAATSALGPHWLGLHDINGHLGLDNLMKEAAADPNSSGRQKVELNLGQLGMLGAASAAAQE